MNQELNKVLSKKNGLAYVHYHPTLSPLFLYLYFVDDYLRRDGNVIFISVHLNLTSFRTICGKMALRIGPKNVHFVQLSELITGSQLSGEGAGVLKTMERKVREKLDCGRPNLIIIDDFTTIQQLSIGAVETFRQFQILQAIRRDLPNDNTSLLLVGCGKEFDALDTFNLMFRLKPIGTGFNAKITGEIKVLQRSSCFTESLATTTKLHYFVGERNFKVFYPGTIQL